MTAVRFDGCLDGGGGGGLSILGCVCVWCAAVGSELGDGDKEELLVALLASGTVNEQVMTRACLLQDSLAVGWSWRSFFCSRECIKFGLA
jgi:hypothetical protein